MALLDHAGDAGLAHDERRVEVGIDDAAEIGGARLEHRRALDDAGVVHEDVGRGSEIGLDPPDELGHGLFVGDVADVAARIEPRRAVVLLRLGDLVRMTRVEGDPRARLAERLGDGHADAVGRAGDEG